MRYLRNTVTFWQQIGFYLIRVRKYISKRILINSLIGLQEDITFPLQKICLTFIGNISNIFKFQLIIKPCAHGEKNITSVDIIRIYSRI